MKLKKDNLEKSGLSVMNSLLEQKQLLHNNQTLRTAGIA